MIYNGEKRLSGSHFDIENENHEPLFRISDVNVHPNHAEAAWSPHRIVTCL